ncbi:SDR family NAD(P)-dependent oxidoreductase [Aestuariivirga litoralis]|uniref:SDR family NAD(P)-dependent oxidoreductase n=1 Tax=Aestuariivirga litoralis TaxID=2650924 RepID=UPI0018C6352D|nr:SDR family NAD(P)-dependent oxidoreductase [Aestuariivirga litoralis]MBG1232061.1 SDR family NAD(P)-dependent oxidoreductase [Aestuariivirga litoralis]
MTHPAFAKGRTAVITGGASGIGLATAQVMAGFGMKVVLIDLPGEKLDAAENALGAVAIGADVSDAGAINAAAARVAKELPPVTFLMNNAGLGPASSAVTASPAWVTILGVNLWGVIHGTQAFAPAMLAHGETALIVNTGSKQGITTPPGNPAYNVSKAGVKAFTEALAHEVRNAPGGKISAHLLIPGWVFTGLTAGGKTEKPAGAWSAAQTVDFMLQSLERGDFYILCPDNDTPRALDEKRIAWAAGDLVENRPALSRWHPDFADAFKAYVNKA